MTTRIALSFALTLIGVVGELHAEEEITILDKSWHVGFSDVRANQQVTEYVLAGETVENWRELVTRQMVADPNGTIPLDRLAAIIRNGFGPDCKGFSWSVVKSTKTKLVYAWSHKGCANFPAQEERTLLLRIPAGICRWAYATKKPPLDDATVSKLDADLATQSCQADRA